MKIKPSLGPVLNRPDEQLPTKSAKAAETSPFKLKEILVPTDFSEASMKALQYALSLAEKFGARITLIHVVKPISNSGGMMVPSEILEMKGALVKSGWKKLESLCNQTIKSAIASNTVVEVGKPYVKIVAAAKTHKTDLIIIATHGYTGLKHFLIGSTAERVVRHAPCPVLTVREPEQDFV